MKAETFFIAALQFVGLSTAAVAQGGKRYTQSHNGVTYNVAEHAATGSKLRYVKNSGICERTEGVNQYSGYADVSDNDHMFFWFFEARKNPKNAPLALWLNGGPGCSSLIGLFQENGPCTLNGGSSEPQLNPNSWNNVANMLYVDQPSGAGFSYGYDGVNSTITAAPAAWKLLQNFYAEFPDYMNRDFGLFTESFGGHYGPHFAFYFQQQNAAIDAGKLEAEKINLVALGVNNGWFDPYIQYDAYADFAVENGYRQILNKTQATQFHSNYESTCGSYVKKCTGLTGSDEACKSAESHCQIDVTDAIIGGQNFDVYDVRAANPDPFPPTTYIKYLTRSDVMKAIGSQGTFTECGYPPYYRFASTGDGSRSLLSELQSVIKSGVNVLIWAGDADWICNWVGNYRVITAIAGDTFKNTALKPFTVNGKEYGQFKSVGNVNWLRVYKAGHETSAYQPEAALSAFTSIISKKGLTSS